MSEGAPQHLAGSFLGPKKRAVHANRNNPFFKPILAEIKILSTLFEFSKTPQQ